MNNPISDKPIKYRNIAGLLLIIAGIVVFMGIITAEAYYPGGYTTALNEISDLGSTRPPNSVIHQPSATIFNLSMMITGILILASVFYLSKSKTRKLLIIPLGIFGLGVIGVGIFPGNTTPHPYFALITFFAGGVAAALSYFSIKGPYKYLASLLGIIALSCLFLNGVISQHIGDGGVERWIAYPITLWMIGLGGYYLGKEDTNISSTTKKLKRKAET